MQHYSFLSLVKQGISGHRRWQPAWRTLKPKKQYDVVIIGGGGHGLATAYFLAKKYRIKDVAVLERAWLGGGNTGRNTQAVRSNYFYPESAAFYEHSLRLYEGLSKELNFNLMLSQRGTLMLAHSEHDLELMQRAVNASLLNGIDAELVCRAQISQLEPLINLDARFPVLGGYLQRRGGIARHDAVAWGFARAADALGVDIIQNCAVDGFHINNNKVCGVQTSLGDISANKVAFAVAGHSTEIARKAGIALPITSMALQAMVSEPIEPVLNGSTVSGAIHMYVSQADRGEIVLGGGADIYNSYAQRGGFNTIEANVSALLELFPRFRRLKLMRQWAGTVDISPDTSPILGKTPVDNLYISCGWGTGGFKAIPAGGDTLAHTIAHDEAHPLIAGFGMGRFELGALIDESAAAGVAH